MFEGYPYRVFYGVLDPFAIHNYCGPPNQAYIDRLNARDGFYERLEASVAREGFQNPILVTSGRQGVPNIKLDRLPPDIRENLDTIVCCDRNGGSRLWVARRLGLAIPCVISDWVGQFAHLEELRTPRDVVAKYRNPPEKLVVNEHGLHVLGLPQTHLAAGAAVIPFPNTR